MSDDVEARKKAAEKGWIGEPQPERPRQMGIIARMASSTFTNPRPSTDRRESCTPVFVDGPQSSATTTHHHRERRPVVGEVS